MQSEYLFVYGSLRQDIPNNQSHRIKPFCRFVQNGFVYGKLFNVSYYPGAVAEPRQQHKVLGNIFEIIKQPAQLFRELDEYEECSVNHRRPHEFIRVKIKVFSTNKELELTAWTYFYTFSTQNLQFIESGDYKMFI